MIRTNHRMTYTSVHKMLALQDSEEQEKFADVLDMLREMESLAAILRKRRERRGSVDFDIPETKVIVDADGKPVEIRPYERNEATKLIEEFMLIANETVAEDFFWRQSPFVYRTHEVPDEDKVEKLEVFLRNFGYYLKVNRSSIHPKEFQKLLKHIEGTPEEALLSRLTLRNMKQAKYTVEPLGHFGLAAKYYCHFTSPIRRYPDLQIHRIIKEHLHGKMTEDRRAHYEKILPEVARLASERERRADEVERETVKLKKAEYMAAFLGDEFEGVISSVTGWGIYVELDNTVEGMIRLEDITDDYYVYEEEKHAAVGQRKHKVYALGDRIRVRLVSVDLMLRTIDFLPVNDDNDNEEDRREENTEEKTAKKGKRHVRKGKG